MDDLCPIKIEMVKIWNMGVSKTNDHIQIKIKIPNPSQEPGASSKTPNQDMKDMDVLWTFIVKREIQKKQNMGVWKTVDHIQIKIKTPNPEQEPQSPQIPVIRTWRTWCAFYLQNKYKAQIFGSWVYQIQATVSISRSRSKSPVMNLQSPPNPIIGT